MDSIIRFAIRNQRLLSFTYKEYHRIVEPYLFGLHVGGQQVLYAFQTSGESLTGEPGWREVELYRVHDLKLLNFTFKDPRFEFIFCKVKLRQIYCEVRAPK
jgi:hypothetical protein